MTCGRVIKIYTIRFSSVLKSICYMYFIQKMDPFRHLKVPVMNSYNVNVLHKMRVLVTTRTLLAVIVGLCAALIVILSHKTDRLITSKQKPFSPLPSDSFRVIDDNLGSLSVRYSPTEDFETRISDSEALASLQAALEMKMLGKADKASKLFQHAVILSPKHPDILTHFGEFIEETKRDILKADELYLRALSSFPDHPGALSNRQRTASIVENLDQEMLKKIDDKRDALSAIPDSNAALRRAKKEAYFQHIYHTVGIEGNTMTLQQTRSIVETRIAVSGKSIDEHNEILGLDAAMKYINSTLINRMRDVTVDDILEIHRRVLGYVDPTEGGYFRRTQVYVGGHVPPGPMFINLLMEQFLKWLNSDDALDLHPVRYAALAHYKLVHIHPFIDGNGRTSRLLMNLLLMQAGYPPVIILKQHRHLYYQHLQTANEGDVRPFVRFIAECTERTLDLYLWATSEFSHHVPALGHPTILVEGSGLGDDIS